MEAVEIAFAEAIFCGKLRDGLLQKAVDKGRS